MLECLGDIQRNIRRSLGFGPEDNGFTPGQIEAGQATIALQQPNLSDIDSWWHRFSCTCVLPSCPTSCQDINFRQGIDVAANVLRHTGVGFTKVSAPLLSLLNLFGVPPIIGIQIASCIGPAGSIAELTRLRPEWGEKVMPIFNGAVEFLEKTLNSLLIPSFVFGSHVGLYFLPVGVIIAAIATWKEYGKPPASDEQGYWPGFQRFFHKLFEKGESVADGINTASTAHLGLIAVEEATGPVPMGVRLGLLAGSSFTGSLINFLTKSTCVPEKFKKGLEKGSALTIEAVDSYAFTFLLTGFGVSNAFKISKESAGFKEFVFFLAQGVGVAVAALRTWDEAHKTQKFTAGKESEQGDDVALLGVTIDGRPSPTHLHSPLLTQPGSGNQTPASSPGQGSYFPPPQEPRDQFVVDMRPVGRRVNDVVEHPIPSPSPPSLHPSPVASTSSPVPGNIVRQDIPSTPPSTRQDASPPLLPPRSRALHRSTLETSSRRLLPRDGDGRGVEGK